MTEREELEARRDTLQKVLEEARAEVAARQAELAQTLSELTRQRDELRARVASRGQALAALEDEAVQLDQDWATHRREAAAARAHLDELRLSGRPE